VHGFADQEPVWSSTRHARGVVQHTRTIGARWLAYVTWCDSLDATLLDADLAATLHVIE
jgi:hypothetical protein